MKRQDHYALIVIAGLTSGMGAASVNIAARFADDPGDILGFFGGAIGAGAAVIGAVYLERFKSRESEKIERTKLKRDVIRFGRLCRAFLESSNKSPLVGQALSISQSWASIVKRHGATSSLDGHFLSSVDAISYWYEPASKSINKLVTVHQNNPSEFAQSKKEVDGYIRPMHTLIYYLLTEVDEWKSDEAASVGDPAAISELKI
jgi:hypothetical protein